MVGNSISASVCRICTNFKELLVQGSNWIGLDRNKELEAPLLSRLLQHKITPRHPPVILIEVAGSIIRDYRSERMKSHADQIDKSEKCEV